jgi:hypothetical protein
MTKKLLNRRKKRGDLHKMSRQGGGKKPIKITKVIKKSNPTKKKDINLKQDVSKVVEESLVENKGQISFKPSSQKSLVHQILSADFTKLPQKEIIKNIAYAVLLIMFGSFAAIEHKTNSRLEKELASKTQQAEIETNKLKKENATLEEKSQDAEKGANELRKENATLLQKIQQAEIEANELRKRDVILRESKTFTDKKSNELESTVREDLKSTTNLHGEKRSMSKSDYLQLTSLVKNYVYLVPLGIMFVLPLLLKNFSSLSNYIRRKVSGLKALFFSSSEPVEKNLPLPQVSERIFRYGDILIENASGEEYKVLRVDYPETEKINDYTVVNYNNYLLKPMYVTQTFQSPQNITVSYVKAHLNYHLKEKRKVEDAAQNNTGEPVLTEAQKSNLRNKSYALKGLQTTFRSRSLKLF